MTRQDAEDFVKEWIAAWNRRDIEHHLRHFVTTARFTSPRALAATGKANVESVDELRDYWNARLSRLKSLHFNLDYYSWDADGRRLTIVYENEADGQQVRACEVLEFNEAGQVLCGEAFFGAQSRFCCLA